VTSFAALHDLTGKVAVAGGSRGIGRAIVQTLAVNLKGPFRLAVLTATHMAAHDGGSIINIGTPASLTAGVQELPYLPLPAPPALGQHGA
jgi:NAD(P)-dependent dehydrogenase (short-subunit alcohol dehydrogenase family)